MAAHIADLENQLLTLTRKRVEIDLQWIAISGKLLTAKANVSEAQDQEVPQVSERSEYNSNLPTTQTADFKTLNPDAREEIHTNTHAVADIETSPTVALNEVEVSANSAVQDVQDPSRLVQAEVPKEESLLNTSVNIEEPSEASVNEPVRAASPIDDLPSDITQQETTQQEPVSQSERHIPPPPTIVATSAMTDTQPSIRTYNPDTRMIADTTVAQQTGPYIQHPAAGIDLGNKQLLRTQRASLRYPQRANVQNPSPSANVPQSLEGPVDMSSSRQSHYPRSPETTSVLLPSSAQTNPGSHPIWQPRQTQQQHDSSTALQLKAERMQAFPYLPRSPATSQNPISYQTPLEHLITPPQQSYSPRPQSSQSSTRQSQHQIHVGDARQSPLVSAQFIPPRFAQEPHHTGAPQRRKRSPSLQITDVRPAQKPRLGDRPFGADPTLSSRRIKVEENAGFGFEEPRKPGRSIHAQTHPSRSVRTVKNKTFNVNPSASRRQTDVDQKIINVSSTSEQSASHHAHSRPLRPYRSPTSASHRAKSQRDIDEDYDDEENEEEDIEDEFDVINIQPQRQAFQDEDFADLAEYDDGESPLTAGLATRTTFGAPKPIQRAPLSAEEKHALELRYCARVAMVIGSKRCVIAPVEQISKTKNIFTIMRQKFGHVVEGEEPLKSTIKPYRNATDFVIDARGMLQCYVALGHCIPCPFRNPRVMCWRMRLESILDQKMRGLKTCLKNCVENFDPDDAQGRMDYVDSWFNDEELQEDVDLF